MGKLLKYEFVKNKIALLIGISVVALLQINVLLDYASGSYSNMVASMGTEISALFILIFIGLSIGIKTYTKELNDKSGYMLYMTPNSIYTIIISKYLFFGILEIGYLFLAVLLCKLNLLLLGHHSFMDWDDYFFFGPGLSDNLPGFVNFVYNMLLYVMVLMVLVSLYMAIYTFSSTLVDNTHGKKWITSMILVFLLVLIGRFNLYVLLNISSSIYEKTSSVFLGTLPYIVCSLVLILGSMFTTAHILEKKLNL